MICDLTVSVIIPTFNRKDLLEKCLCSLVDQTYPQADYEIIVVDDGSTDETSDFLATMKNKYGNLRCFREKNKGMYPAWNFGASKANGEIFVFIDSDCVVNRSFLESVAHCFEGFPDIAMHVGNEIPVFQNPLLSALNKYHSLYPEKKYQKDTILSGFTFTQIMSSNRCAITKSAFFGAGGFNKKYGKGHSAGADTELCLFLLKRGYKIRSTNDFFVHHYQRHSISKILARYYLFGITEAQIFKEFYSGWIVLCLPFNKTVCFRHARISLFLDIGTTFEILTFIFIMTICLPKIGSIIIVLYILFGLIELKVKPGNILIYLAHKIYTYITSGASVAGNIAGSIKYGVINL